MASLLILRDEKTRLQLIRAIKTVFFLITMMFSLLVFSAPAVLLAVADTILPSALLSAYLSANYNGVRNTAVVASASISEELGGGGASTSRFFLSSIWSSVSSNLQNYDFRNSLIDIPLISIARSIIILFVYSCCDGPRLSRGPYLYVATACSAGSVVFVSLKASFVFGIGRRMEHGGSYDHDHWTEVALFCCSYALAVGHIVVAYRTSCRERKKLLVYKIDIEAVSAACKNAFPKYQKKLLQQERKK